MLDSNCSIVLVLQDREIKILRYDFKIEMLFYLDDFKIKMLKILLKHVNRALGL